MRGRVEAAWCAGPEADFETTVDKTLGGDRLLGGFYPVISEAIAIGARLAIFYRASDECSPSTRLVDPKFIEVSGDAAYLVAWNVEKDAQRSYRLDRIANAELTDDYLVAWNVEKDAQRSYRLDRIANAELTDDSVERSWPGTSRKTPSAATASIASRMPSSPTIPLSAMISPRILPPKACAPMVQTRPCAS